MIPEELHKRLDEIAIEMYPVHIGNYFCGGVICKNGDTNQDTRETLIEGGIIGYELGYKEAIAQCKEWMKDRNRHACKEWLDKECADFEADMLKLWEGEK